MKALEASQELLRRRREERLRYFKPIKPDDPNAFGVPSNDQVGFLHSSAKIRGIFGGNRSSKTEAATVDSLWTMLGIHPVRSRIHPPPVFGRYLAPSYERGVRTILKKIQTLVPRHLVKGGCWDKAWSEKSATFTTANGSALQFFTYEQSLNKMGGDDVDFFVGDEHMPEKMFIENLMRTADRNGYAVLAMTPESGITWEEEKIIEASEFDPSVEFWMFTTFGNPYLSKEGVAEVEKQITDPRLRDAKLYGKFVSLSGLVYSQFSRGTHVVPDTGNPKSHWHQQFIIDPHHRKNSCMIWTAWDPDGNVCYVHREAEFEPSAGGVSELAAFIRAKSSGCKVDVWIGDEAQGGEGINIHGKQSVLKQLRIAGIPVQGTNQASEKNFASGVYKVREMLMPDPLQQKPRLYISQSCPKTIKQMSTYQYRKETIVDEELLREHVRNKNDDFPTCIRYGVMGETDVGSAPPKSELDGNW